MLLRNLLVSKVKGKSAGKGWVLFFLLKGMLQFVLNVAKYVF